MTQQKYLVTSENLNVRSSPQVADNNKLGGLQRGTIVHLVNDTARPWGQICAQVGDTKLEGFAHLDYLTPLSKEVPEAFADELEAVIDAASLKKIMTLLGKDKLGSYLPYLQSAMLEFDIANAPRKAAFLAQLSHESGELRYMEEIASGEAYEGRKDLGNTQKGDGRRYKGRGPIQVTGRSNYTRYGKLLGLDLVTYPELAATPQVGFRIAGAFWKGNKLNEYADEPGNFKLITKIINGGYNGLEDRQKYHTRAKEVLGVPVSYGGSDEDREVDPEDPRLVPLLPRGAAYEEALVEAGRL